MRAQPLLKSFWPGKKFSTFLVQYNHFRENSLQTDPEKLPEAVLRGWFAHEIGHVVDYQDRGFINIFWLGLGYMFFPRYRKKVEFTADCHAVENGFGDDILATKRYILEHSNLNETYKARIRKYYMPSAEVMELMKEIDKMEAVELDQSSPLDLDP